MLQASRSDGRVLRYELGDLTFVFLENQCENIYVPFCAVNVCTGISLLSHVSWGKKRQTYIIFIWGCPAADYILFLGVFVFDMKWDQKHDVFSRNNSQDLCRS